MPTSRHRQLSRASKDRSLSQEKRNDARREILLEHALERFARQGFHRTTIEELCSASGVTTRYFYQLFGSKETLMLALLERIMHACVTAAQQSYSASQERAPRERIDAVVNAFTHAYTDDPRYAKVGAIAAVGATPAIEERRRQSVRDLANLIEAIGQDFFRGLGLSVTWGTGIPLAVVGGANELIYAWTCSANCDSSDTLIRELNEYFDILLRGLLERNQVTFTPQS